MTFKPGDKVVYPHHGAAVIEEKKKIKAFGANTEYFVLRMAHGDMVLSVPVDKVEEVGMRWPISKEDVVDLFEGMLASPGPGPRRRKRGARDRTYLQVTGALI